MRNLSREMETIKKNSVEILEFEILEENVITEK